MQIEQSVLKMNGSPPTVFAPGLGVGRGQDIPVKNVSIKWAAVTDRAANTQVTTSENLKTLAALTLEITEEGEVVATLPDIPFEVTRELDREVIFDSEHQNTPWNFLLKINPESRQMILSFTLSYAGLSVGNALTGITFYQALARGGEFVIKGRHPITGEEFFLARGKIPSGSYEPADERFVKLLKDLAFIENKTGVSFVVPEHSIGFPDVSRIAATAEILKTGHAQYKAQPWVSVSKVEQAQNALESFASERSIPMALHFEGEVVKIFGVYVSLGPVTLFCKRSYITREDLELLRKELEIAGPGSYLNIKFTPFEDCTIEARYLKWLPSDEADSIKDLPMYVKSEAVAEEDEWSLPQMNVDAAVALLKSWYEEDPDEQKTSWERLKVALDEDRFSDRKHFQ